MRAGPSRVSSHAATTRPAPHAIAGRYALAVVSLTGNAWPRAPPPRTRVMRTRETPADESWKATIASRPAVHADGQNVDACFVPNGSTWTGSLPGGAR